MNPVHLRLLNQQLAAQQFSDPVDVVSHLGAIQAQEYRLMRWGVAMRTRKPSAEAFRQAFDSGRILRLHLLRGTWQLITADDYPWLRDLCMPRARATILGWMHANHISLPDEEVRHIRAILERTAGDLGSATKEDFAEALRAHDISMTDQRLSYHIRMGELDGCLVSGNLLPMKATYALTERKVPSAPLSIDRDEALLRFAHKYFQSHQPATLEDFVWWSGMNKGDCLRGMALLGDTLHKEVWGGREFYLLDGCRTRGCHSDECLLIPPYDEYLIGYKSRDLVLDPVHRHLAHNNSGNFNPIVVQDGIVCGNWSPFAPDVPATFFPGYDAPDLTTARSRYLAFRGK